MTESNPPSKTGPPRSTTPPPRTTTPPPPPPSIAPPRSPTSPPAAERGDRSDLFKLSYLARQIPTITRLPLTKEERRKRIALLALAVAGAVALVVAVVSAVLHVRHQSRLESAVQLAGDDGRLASVHAALEVLGGGDTDAEKEFACTLACDGSARGRRESRSRDRSTS